LRAKYGRWHKTAKRYYVFWEHCINFIYFACLAVCLFVSNKLSKRLNPSEPNFVWDLTWPKGKVYGWSKFQKLASNKIRISLNLKNPQNFFIKFPNFVLMYTMKLLTIEIEDRSEAPWKLCVVNLNCYCIYVICSKIIFIFYLLRSLEVIRGHKRSSPTGAQYFSKIVSLNTQFIKLKK